MIKFRVLCTFIHIITIQGQFTDQLSELQQSFTFLDLSKLEKSLDLNILFRFSSCDSDDKYGLKQVEYSNFRNFMQQKFSLKVKIVFCSSFEIDTKQQL